MEHEGVPMVSYSRGSMNSLLHKLTKLKTVSNKGLPRAHVEGLLEALTGLNWEFVEKLAGRHETDRRVKEWMKQMRQLVVDIEDWVDCKLLDMQELDDENFEDLMAQIRKACERCTRYELLKAPTDPAVLVDVVPNNAPAEPANCHLLLGERPTTLVGVDGPTEEIVNQLTNEHEKMLKVVSILGMEGLGKTTLAKKIYEKLQGKFDRQAFVSVGRRTSVSNTLDEILRQVQPNEKKVQPNMEFGMPRQDMQTTITDIRKCLASNRYFIVIDGVWSARDWKIINCAFPDKNRGSRVLTTTCIPDLANPSNILHQMKALNEIDSKSIFDGEDAKRPLADSILKLCGGMPLAIIVAAGLLSTKSVHLPRMIGKSDSTSAGMTEILYMSYAYLSVPLKSCFMYLSAFPEGYTIEKDRLIRLWRAEGFIPGNKWETGERYFNELITRRLIQPIFGYEDDRPVGCTVHGVILDFMASLSREENFITLGAELEPRTLETDLPSSVATIGGAEWTTRLLLCYETVQHLSLHLGRRGEGNNLISCNVQLSRVRSLMAFGESLYMDSVGSVHLPYLKEFKLIRILDLEGIKYGITYSIIGKFSLLRYLGLAGTIVCSEDIENMGEFDHLQTLDIRKTRVKGLPSRMHLMPSLVSVLCDGLCFSSQSSGSLFENVQNLEELSTINVNDETTLGVLARLLISSKKLRKIGVNVGVGVAFSSNSTPLLDKLQKYNLESLAIECGDSCCSSLREWAPSPKLQRYRLAKTLSRVPESWASLDSLTHLDITIHKMEANDVLIIGKLPKLIVLKVCSTSPNYSGKAGSIISKVGFRGLEVAWFKWAISGMELHFEDGSMPKLRKLRLEFNAGKSRKKDAIGNLPSNLMQVHVTIKRGDSSPTDMEDVERAIRKQISYHPNKPNLSLELIARAEPFKSKKMQDDTGSSLAPWF
ncbi:disease resistance protein RGA5-like [Triticum dicoccoides]|uniref:disease resistance protein RGA5-like n=1 Tax=Triticum dicoccoides TaxID=85692 RepID=UPI00188E9A81|nr:disease resistance protein RGA5-like [Triticum dicoccoides]